MPFDNIITDYDLYIVYFVIYIFCFYSSAYLYVSAQKISLNWQRSLFLITTGIISALVYSVLHSYNQQIHQLYMYITIPVLISLLNQKHYYQSLVVSLISLCIYRVFKMISTILVAVIAWMFGIVKENLIIYLIISVVSLGMCILFMRFKRFRRGFQFFQDDSRIGLGLVFSGVLFVLTCFGLREYNDKDAVFVVVIVGTVISGFGLYLWIRRSITALYRSRQQSRAEERYQEVIEERDKEIEKLNQSNAYLAKIVHRDNHLMSNVNTSIDMYFNSNDETYKETLLRDLQTLAKERSEVINKEQLESKLLPSTGNLLIDGAVNDLYIKAAAHGIDFNQTATSTVDEIIGKYISQTDLQTLLCDHIKDAIIAVDSYGESGGKILVNLSKQNDNYCIDIYDSGVAFEPDTLSKLGTERVTTHADSGGSGIGFMTTFETIKKAYASLIITEFEHRSPFSKSVSFRFDGESAFIINSYRKDELQQLTTRNDVIYL